MASSSFSTFVKLPHSSSSSSSFLSHRRFLLPPLPSPRHFHRRFKYCQSPLTTVRAFARQEEEEEENEEERREQERLISNLSVEELEQKLGKRRRSKKERGGIEREKRDGKALQSKPPPKDWEAMSLSEKALELYVGERGALFWLNKLAYASIFIIIGGWIAFRFVGPALNLYQLESPLLPPDQVLRGSSL